MLVVGLECIAVDRDDIRLDAAAEQQDRTDVYFGDASTYWRDVYEKEELQGRVYRERMQAALDWIYSLHLNPGARILEVGGGAGWATLELARRGYSVHSTDSSAEMVALAAKTVEASDLGGVVEVSVADVHDLPFEAGSVDVVLALGVLPWLYSPQRALAEVSRVLAPGGHAILSADNRLRLNGLVEPAESPLVVPLKYAWRAVQWLRGRRRTDATSRLHTPARVNRWLTEAGLEPERWTTIGFGPFTCFWRPVLPDHVGHRLHSGLSRLAERRLRRHGWHYLVCARRV